MVFHLIDSNSDDVAFQIGELHREMRHRDDHA